MKWLIKKKIFFKCHAKEVKSLDFDMLPTERAFGVQWNVESDQFGFKITINDHPAICQGILSVVSSIYDHLALVAPFILNAKLILQDLCHNKYGWDRIYNKICEAFSNRLQKPLHELPTLKSLAINRCFKPPNTEQVVSTQLYHFADSSIHGYGSISYLQLEDSAGIIHGSIITGKWRLAPTKPVTIPRLKLSVAVVAAHQDQMYRKELSLKIDESQYLCPALYQESGQAISNLRC